MSGTPDPHKCLVGWGSERKMSGPAKHLKVCQEEYAICLQTNLLLSLAWLHRPSCQAPRGREFIDCTSSGIVDRYVYAE